MTGWMGTLLRVRLAWKLVGANLLIALAGIGAVAYADRYATSRSPMILIVTAAVVAALIVNFALVGIALRPLHSLEVTARDVVNGNFNARVPQSAIADDQMQRVAATVNLLLDTVSGDRESVRRLARRVIETSDQQRAAVAHRLHDSTAQTLAAVMMQIGAAARDATNPALVEKLNTLHDSLSNLTEDVRVIAQGMHPRVLEDLGLPAALRELAREMSIAGDIEVVVDEASGDAALIPLSIASALFNVAEEAVENAISHGHPTTVRIMLDVSDVAGSEHATLTILDDRHAVDPSISRTDSAHPESFVMRERLTLLHGRCEIRHVAGGGTRLIARVPLHQEVSLAGVST